jgi:hypothetical protein
VIGNADAKPRECLPGGSFVHCAPNHDECLQSPVHWQICKVHKTRWRWGQGWEMGATMEKALCGEGREQFFREYREGHCPGYIAVVNRPTVEASSADAGDEDLPF